jgi:hypothetical protein
MPNFAEWSESNQPNKPNGPTPNPRPGPRQSFSAPFYFDNPLQSFANSMGSNGSESSVESSFDQFGGGGSSKHEDDDLASELAQRKVDQINILLRVIGELGKHTKDLDQNQRDNFGNLQEAQNKILEELGNFKTAVKSELEFRQSPNNLPNNPPINPNGEDFIPEPEPQVPFHQVEQNTPGEGLAPGSEIPWLGVTVEPKGPRGNASNLVSTLPGKTYVDTDTEEPQVRPFSELKTKRPKGPRPGQPTIPHQQPKPPRTPPPKPKTKPKPKPKPQQ